MVEVFITNIKLEKQADLLLEQFQKKYPTYCINFDLEDCDNILRVESYNDNIDVNGIMEIVKYFGFSAAILPDIPVSKKMLSDHRPRVYQFHTLRTFTRILSFISLSIGSVMNSGNKLN